MHHPLLRGKCGYLSRLVAAGLCVALTSLVARPAQAAPQAPVVYVARDGTGDFNCDGSSDNIEIQDALNYVAANPSFTSVYLKTGTYSISDTMTVSSNTELTGDKQAIIRLIDNIGWQSESSSIFVGTRVQNFKVHGFEIDGNRDNQSYISGDHPYYILVLLKLSKNIEFYDMHLHHSWGDGLKVQNSMNEPDIDNISFHDNQIEYLGHEGAYLLYLTGAKLYNNRIITASNSGCRIDSCDQVEMYNNDIQGSTTYTSTGPCIEIQNSVSDSLTDVVIHDNYLHDSRGNGIWAFDTAQKTGTRIHVHHNVFKNTGNFQSDFGYSSSGILLEGVSAEIHHNVFFSCQKSGIRTTRSALHSDISLGSYAVNVTNNVIMGSRAYQDGTGAALWNELPNYQVTAGYNCFYDNAGGNTQGTGITLLSTVSQDPLFANTADGDFHLQSKYGRWSGSDWVFDTLSSPCIDAADPLSPYSLEPMPNGGRANIGRYGNTSEASRSAGEVPPTDAGVSAKDGSASDGDSSHLPADGGSANADSFYLGDGELARDAGPGQLPTEGVPSPQSDASAGCGCRLGARGGLPATLPVLWAVPFILGRVRRARRGRLAQNDSKL
jgi:hypothetical protein